VANLQEAAANAPAMIATTHTQRALQAALDFGLGDLSEKLRNELMASIRKAIPEFKRISGTLTIPKECIDAVDAILAQTASIAGAVRQLALLPGLLEVDGSALRESASEQLKESPVAALMPTEQFHRDGKVTFRSNDFEGNVERRLAMLVGGHLVMAEAILAYFLQKTAGRIDERTLFDALAEWPHLPSHRAAMLSVASERFASRDFVSSGVIILTQYEALLRDLMRAIGYSALKVERGVQMDETLNSLLRAAPVIAVLGEPHTRLAEYVLCEPELGWNLRNEVAHGTIRPDTLTPSRVLFAWLLLLRVTCFVARKESDDGTPTTAAGNASSQEPTAPPGEGTPPLPRNARLQQFDRGWPRVVA
jgi:hypothetical protein